MKKQKETKTYQEINEKIRQGRAVVVTAEDMIDLVERHGDVEAARRVDVVTTGTFSPMVFFRRFFEFRSYFAENQGLQSLAERCASYGGLAAVIALSGQRRWRKEIP
jgi:uncharacterized protein (DUF39 family)